MAIDFTTVLLDQDNEPLKDMMAMQANGGTEVILTLGRATAHALNYQGQDEANLGGDDKFKRGMLAFTVRDNASCMLKSEEVTLIKRQLARIFSPLVIYRCYPLLDIAEKPEVEAVPQPAGAP